MNSEQQTQQADDPGGPGWRDVWPDEVLRHGDLFWNVDHWQATQHAGQPAVDERTYRRRIEPQQSSDSEPDLRQRLAEAEALVAEAERGGQQVNAELQQLREQLRELTGQTQCDAAELQQLREQVQALTMDRDRYRNQLEGAIEHSNAPEAQAQLVDRLQAWLRPVLELVAEHPEDASPLAVAVLGYLPGIASRLIKE